MQILVEMLANAPEEILMVFVLVVCGYRSHLLTGCGWPVICARTRYDNKKMMLHDGSDL